MNKWLNYHHLLYFKVIASEGSIADASKRLLIGQSALSTQLKKLEESLGQKLFERKNKRLILTEAGRVALEYADDIFKKGEEFLQVFNQQSLSTKSLYRIGVVASAPKVVACDHVEMGNLTTLLNKILPSVDDEKTEKERNSSNPEFVEKVSEINVRKMVNAIVERSVIIKELVEKGKVAIIGGIHNIATGKVEFFDDTLKHNA